MRALRQLKFLYMCHIAHFAEENSKFLFSTEISPIYSHLFNKRGGWNKRGGGAKVAKSLNVELGINVAPSQITDNFNILYKAKGKES